MGLPRALVDRARRVYSREDPTTAWREGQPEAAEAFGPWMAVRFRPGGSNEVEVPDRDGYGYVDEQARLLIGVEYEDGASLIDPVSGGFLGFDADDMVEIQSELETDRWFVDGGMGVLRRRRGVVGFTCNLRRAREATVETGLLAAVEPGAEPDTDQPDDVAADIQVPPQLARPVVPAGWEHEGG